MQIKPAGEGGAWRSVSMGKQVEVRESGLTSDTAYIVRARTHNQAGASEYTVPETRFSTRQLPVDDGGRGPSLDDTDLIENGLLTSGLESLLSRSEGGVRLPLYTWTQTEQEVVLRLRVPCNCRGRDLSVKFLSTKLIVDVAVDGGATTSLISGVLRANIRPDDCTWNLEDDGELEVTLEKAEKGKKGEKRDRWSCVIVGHPLIDINM